MNHIFCTKVTAGTAGYLFVQQAICADLWPKAPRPAVCSLRIFPVQCLRFASRHTITTKTALCHTKVHFRETAFSAFNQALRANLNAIIAALTGLQECRINSSPRRAQHGLHRLSTHPPSQQTNSRWIQRRINEILDPVEHGFCFVFSSILTQLKQRFFTYSQRINPSVSFQNRMELLPIRVWINQIPIHF
jgi:hypothetical protein